MSAAAQLWLLSGARASTAMSADAQGWNRIMTTIALDPVSKAHVMYDILNEPDCRSIGWEGGGSGRSMVR